MRVVLDTNRYVDFCRGEVGAVTIVQRASVLLLPFIVLAELRAGFQCGGKRSSNEEVLLRFMASSRVEVLYPDAATVNLYAGLYAQMRRQGTPIPTHDIWIAALAIQHDATLATRDVHFNHIPQLSRV